MRILIILIFLTFALFNHISGPVTCNVTLTVEDVEKIFTTTLTNEEAGVVSQRTKYGFGSYYDWQTDNVSFEKEDGFPAIKIWHIDSVHGLHPFFANLIATFLSAFFIMVYRAIKSVDEGIRNCE